MASKIKLLINTVLVLAVVSCVQVTLVSRASALTAPTPDGSGSGSSEPANPPGKYYCGDSSGQKQVNTSIDLGCKGQGNPILDLLFAIIRFLSIGVGLVIVGSMVYASLQYIGSRGDPNANAQAIKRIQANVTALLLFIFAYAIVNYIVPGQFLK